MTREISASGTVMSVALVASILTHAAMLLATRLPTGDLSEPLNAPAVERPLQAATWVGTTAELPSGEALYDVQLTGVPPSPAAPSVAEASAWLPPSPLSAPPPSSPSTVASPRPALPAAPVAAAKPRADRRPKPKETDPYEDLSLAPKHAPRADRRPPVAARPAVVGAGSPAPPAASSQPSAASPLSSAPGLGGADIGGGSFGAVGRAGVRDLGRAFTQAIPAACSTDSIWSKLPLGDAGTVRIVLDVDGSGRLSSWKPVEPSPSKQLLSLGARTFAALQSGTFALRGGSVTSGQQTVQVSVTIGESGRAVPEGGQIELSHTYDGGIGHASFIQPSGREVKFVVRVLRVEPAAASPG